MRSKLRKETPKSQMKALLVSEYIQRLNFSGNSEQLILDRKPLHHTSKTHVQSQ